MKKDGGLKINYILALDKSSLGALISVCWHLSKHPWCLCRLGVRGEEPLLHTIMGIWYVVVAVAVVVYATCPFPTATEDEWLLRCCCLLSLIRHSV